ncbi:putative repeat protein (TIGR01451 family) [Streptosporangium becharense]|uniref:Putative repeat protein (TIGR01451 family) n=1 Tax=Streptosporangium becharense TaxID=1816182 RepID=A0A7W9MIZ9_9ACTN|nr:PKD domain-containing protein [Streptosporangium becharense]MBB2913148.1 putative repeat protein (TIGR01451 family) [Streptosporangium becharense]MBB5822131.1 putative repeat protein (TIGR01451 family) [Streptosporangium becharense]
MNDKGQMTGGNWIRDAGASTLLLGKQPPGTETGQITAKALNNSGSAVGIINRGGNSFDAFRSTPGQPLAFPRDSLVYESGDFESHHVQALDINDNGETAGFALSEAGGEIAVIWDEDGEAHRQHTDFGGRVSAINNAGVGVGVHLAANGAPRAALYVDNQAVDLTDLARAAGYDVTLRYATGINDRGEIAVIGRLGKQTIWDQAYLIDLGTRPVIDALTVETQRYPSTEWTSVPDGAGRTVEGNKVRVTTRVTNPSGFPLTAEVRLVDGVSGRSIVKGAQILELDPHETVTAREIWDTTDWAWEKIAKPQSDRAVVAKLYYGGTPVDDETEGIVITPKPVVAVHGFRSDAEDTFGEFDEMMKELGHPEGHVFAVGDGQAEGRMDTGEKWNPLHESYRVWQNVDELATYIEGVRKKTGAFYVNVVAHSMGGLITRQYVQTKMPSTPDHKPAVTRLIGMGVPNAGSPCADMLVEKAIIERLSPWYPAVIELTTDWMIGEEEKRNGFNDRITNLRGVRASNLVGVKLPVPCTTMMDPFPHLGDTVVPWWSALLPLPGWDDHHSAVMPHSFMTFSEDMFKEYVLPRLASLTFGAPDPDPVPGLTGERSAAKPDRKAGATVPAADGAGQENSLSVFAGPAATVEPGQTAKLPLQVPQGLAFGVTGVLPETVGLALRDPSGKVTASYTAGSDQAKQPFQGLSATDPQAGAWTLEVTNTAAQAVKADLAAWVTGNPVKVAAETEAADDGRVTVKAAVTDGGQPVTGATVQAWLVGVEQASARVELTLNDDGASGDGAAGDGVYGARTDALADDRYYLVTKADTAKGLRTDRGIVEVAKPDTREFELKLSATPGGSVTASPAQDKYRAGTEVKLTATPEAGRVPIGWTVDGEKRGPGALTITMDGPHTVEARFGTYTVTEIGALPGGDASRTEAESLNDRGQVAATVADKDGKRRAVRWQDGAFTELAGPACTDGAVKCEAAATGINEAGEVVGWAHASVGGGNAEHAVVWRADGSVTDLQPGTSSNSSAVVLNDNDQTLGYTRSGGVLWDQGATVTLPADYAGGGYGYDNEWSQNRLPRINGSGAVAGGYARSRNSDGSIRDTGPMLYARDVLTKLPGTVEGCVETGGRASDVNDAGLVVGTLRCGRYEGTTTKHAYVWKDGEPTDLGAGEATAVNDHGVIAGSDPGDLRNVLKPPVLWVDGVKHQLSGVLSRPWCPGDAQKTTQPCVGVGEVLDLNSSGQILVRGFVRDRSAAQAGFVQTGRALLLTPTPARADLEVKHTVSVAEPGPGSKVTWTATVTNKGEHAATDVRLDVLVPQEVTGAACETWRGVCTAINGGFRNVAEVLEPGWSATVEVTATVPADAAEGTVLKARATAASTEVVDPEPDNNAAEATATVRHALNRTAISWADPVRVDETSHEVEVTLTNRGDKAMPVKAVATESPFRQINDCPRGDEKLEPGTGCTVKVMFAPTQVGPASGKLTFTTEGTEPSHVVTLTGRGIERNAKPVIKFLPGPTRGTVGRPFTLRYEYTDADITDTHTAVIEWGDGPGVEVQVAPNPAGGGGIITATRTFEAPFTGEALLGVTDSKGDITWAYDATVSYVIEEAGSNTAPVVTAGPDVELTVNETLNRVVSFTDPGSTSWTATVDYGDGAGPQPVTPAGQEITLEHRWATAGTYPVIVTVRDDGGLQTSAVFTATVVPGQTPNQAPRVELDGPSALAEGSTWRTDAVVTDPDSTAWSATVDYGDGSGPRAVPVDGGKLPVELVATDDGERTVTVKVTDDKGATGTAKLTVKIINKAPQAVLKEPATAETIVAVGAAVPLKATFTDEGVADTHTATWTIGDQRMTGALAEHDGVGTVAHTHTFTKAGRYPISVTVTDDDGGTITTDTVGGKKAYVTVYNTTGTLFAEGKVASPAGSCRLNTACDTAGTATFTIAAAYVLPDYGPTGEVEYDVPGLRLRGQSYTVLAAADGTAFLRGEGVLLDGVVEVTFEVTAIDAAKTGYDQLGVKVWRKNGELVYDNQRDGVSSFVDGTVQITG